MTPRLLCVLASRMGPTTAQVRALRFRERFAEAGWDATFVDVDDVPPDRIVAAAAGVDVVYLVKVPSLSLVRRLRQGGRPRLVFDLTDALWRAYHRRTGWWDVEQILVEVDAVFTENRYMCAYARRYNDRVFDIPASAQVEMFDAMAPRLPARTDGRVVIGWIGSRWTVSAIARVAGALEAVSARYPDVDVRLVGCTLDALPAGCRVRATAQPEYDDAVMVREVLGMDIGLYPPPIDLEDYALRGPQKALIYMAGGVPPVCQNAGDCARIITDGVTGMLASSLDEWTSRLTRLVASPELRRTIGARARALVRDGHRLSDVFDALVASLRAVIDQPPAPPPPLARRMRAACARALGKNEVRARRFGGLVWQRLSGVR